jgi:hypothetical protein
MERRPLTKNRKRIAQGVVLHICAVLTETSVLQPKDCQPGIDRIAEWNNDSEAKKLNT